MIFLRNMVSRLFQEAVNARLPIITKVLGEDGFGVGSGEEEEGRSSSMDHAGKDGSGDAKMDRREKRKRSDDGAEEGSIVI